MGRQIIGEGFGKGKTGVRSCMTTQLKWEDSGGGDWAGWIRDVFWAEVRERMKSVPEENHKEEYPAQAKSSSHGRKMIKWI